MQPGSNLWQAVLGEIELSVSRGNFMTWFKQTQLLKYDDEAAVIGVPNVFIKQQLERKYNDLIADTLKKNGLTPSRIDYKIHTVTPRRTADEPVDSPIMRMEARPAGATFSPAQSRNAFGGVSSSLSHTY